MASNYAIDIHSKAATIKGAMLNLDKLSIVNKAGGTYLLSAPFGYHLDCNLFRAYAYIAQAGMLTGSCEVNLRFGSHIHETAARAVRVWYIPEFEQFHRYEKAAPRDKNGIICGRLVAGDVTDSNLCNWIGRGGVVNENT